MTTRAAGCRAGRRLSPASRPVTRVVSVEPWWEVKGRVDEDRPAGSPSREGRIRYRSLAPAPAVGPVNSAPSAPDSLRDAPDVLKEEVVSSRCSATAAWSSGASSNSARHKPVSRPGCQSVGRSGWLRRVRRLQRRGPTGAWLVGRFLRRVAGAVTCSGDVHGARWARRRGCPEAAGVSSTVGCSHTRGRTAPGPGAGGT